ncbi:MAG: hypothetical protein J6M20_13080 [Clostridia bacterium]|nr:hypothetical protein [Clostridia bacterium]
MRLNEVFFTAFRTNSRMVFAAIRNFFRPPMGNIHSSRRLIPAGRTAVRFIANIQVFLGFSLFSTIRTGKPMATFVILVFIGIAVVLIVIKRSATDLANVRLTVLLNVGSLEILALPTINADAPMEMFVILVLAIKVVVHAAIQQLTFIAAVFTDISLAMLGVTRLLGLFTTCTGNPMRICIYCHPAFIRRRVLHFHFCRIYCCITTLTLRQISLCAKHKVFLVITKNRSAFLAAKPVMGFIEESAHNTMRAIVTVRKGGAANRADASHILGVVFCAINRQSAVKAVPIVEITRNNPGRRVFMGAVKAAHAAAFKAVMRAIVQLFFRVITRRANLPMVCEFMHPHQVTGVLHNGILWIGLAAHQAHRIIHAAHFVRLAWLAYGAIAMGAAQEVASLARNVQIDILANMRRVREIVYVTSIARTIYTVSACMRFRIGHHFLALITTLPMFFVVVIIGKGEDIVLHQLLGTLSAADLAGVVVAGCTSMLGFINLRIAARTYRPMGVCVILHSRLRRAARVSKLKIHISRTAGVAYTRIRTQFNMPLLHTRGFATIRAIHHARILVICLPFSIGVRTLHIRGRTDLLRVHMPHRTQHIQQKNKCTNNRKPFHPYSPLNFWNFWLNYTAFCTLFQCLFVTRNCVQPVTIMQA